MQQDAKRQAKINLVAKQYIFPFVLITMLFFLWGGARAVMDVLNKHIQLTMDVTKTHSALMQAVVYGAYFLMALPAGMMIRRLGTRIGVIIGLLLFGICRLLQGIGLGGEWGGAVLMSFESAPESKRAFYGSLPQIGMSIGLLLASGVIALLSAILSPEAFLSWGWRVAFILSAVLLIVGSYMRMTVQETKDFAEAKAKAPEAKFPLIEVFKKYPKMVLAGMGARFLDGVSFNVFGVYSLTYLTQQHGVHREAALSSLIVASAVMAVAIPFWGQFADRHGKAKIFGICVLLLGIISFPAFWVLHNYAHNFVLVTLTLTLAFAILHAGQYATMASLFSDSFPAEVRYSGISFVYQFTAIFASGLTPMIATALTGWADGQPWYLCMYFCFWGVVSALCTYALYKMSPQVKAAAGQA